MPFGSGPGVGHYRQGLDLARRRIVLWRSGLDFFGWYLTAYVFYQVFAICVRHREPRPQSRAHWRLPIVLYALSAAGNLLLALPAVIVPDVVFRDDSGHPWRIGDILANCVLISLFVMLSFAVIAWLRSTKAAFRQCTPT